MTVIQIQFTTKAPQNFRCLAMRMEDGILFEENKDLTGSFKEGEKEIKERIIKVFCLF